MIAFLQKRTWGKIAIGSLVWCVVFTAEVMGYLFTIGETNSEIEAYTIPAIATLIASSLALFASDRRITVKAVIGGFVAWQGFLIIYTKIYENTSFRGPFVLTGRYIEVGFIGDFLDLLDGASFIAICGSLVFFGGRRLLQPIHKKGQTGEG